MSGAMAAIIGALVVVAAVLAWALLPLLQRGLAGIQAVGL